MASRSLAVVGAGPAGLGAAYALSGSDVDVTLIEAEERAGGRVVTRRRGGYCYDTGANYVTPADGRMEGFVSELGTDGLVDIEEPVWTHNAAGQVSEGDPDRQDDHRWTYESGIAEFARRLADRADATLRTGTEVERLRRRGEGWEVVAEGEDPPIPADGVLLTPPAPRTASILSWTAWEDDRLHRLVRAVDDVPYRAIVTLVLSYPFELDRPYYALVNPDGRHPVGWLSREECKVGHVPAGESLLIVQMSPEWSDRNFAMAAVDAAEVAAGHAADLLAEERLRDPAWTDRDRFAAALPDGRVPEEVAEPVEEAGLFLAGDWIVGEGRVSRAFLNGVDAAERIDARL